MAATQQTRPLSRHERYSVARSNIGHPPLLTFVFTFPDTSKLPDRQCIADRLVQLLRAHPVFAARVVGHTTSRPALQACEPSIEFIQSRLSEREHRFSESTSWEARMETLLQEGTQAGRGYDLAAGDLWRLTRLLPSFGTGESYCVVTVHHTLADGLGALRFAEQTLGLPTRASSLEASTGTGGLPPQLEEAIDVRTSYIRIFRIILQDLVLPRLPAFLAPAWATKQPYWPYLEGAQTSPASTSSDFKVSNTSMAVLSIPTAVLERLRELSARQGLPTLHPVLTTASMVALWIIQSSRASSSSPMPVTLSTPLSERKASTKFPEMGGNYVAASDFPVTLSAKLSFWSVVIMYTNFIRDPSVRKEGRQTWGLLDWIPAAADGSPVTGWEQFLLDKKTSKEPFGQSIGFSNLGSASLPPGATRVAWAQAAQPTDAAINFDCISHVSNGRGETSVAIGCVKEAVPGLRTQDVAILKSTFARLLDVIAGLDDIQSPLLADLRMLCDLSTGSGDSQACS